MTKLEEEMFFAIHGFGPMDGGNTADSELQKELEQQAKAAAAQVALQWIEKAIRESYTEGWIDRDAEGASRHEVNDSYREWMVVEFKEKNGLTPSEPLKEEKGHSFCEKPGHHCTMNYCDDNGCQYRTRHYVDPVTDVENKGIIASNGLQNPEFEV